MQDKEKLDPQEMFKNLSIDEPFLYLERESFQAYKLESRMRRLFGFVWSIQGGLSAIGREAVSDLQLINLIAMYILFIFGLYLLFIDPFAFKKKYTYSCVGITEKWIYYKSGFINKNEDRFLISEISRVVISQSGHERHYNYGTVKVFFKSGRKQRLRNVNDPHRFRSEIEKLMQQELLPASDVS